MTPMPDILTHSQTTEYSATQLVSSIKFKLSHAIMASPSADVEPTPPVSASAAALPWSCDVRINKNVYIIRL